MKQKNARTRLMTNSKAILSTMLDRGLSATEAAAALGVQKGRISRLLQRDQPIRYKTAHRLRNVFGKDAVTILYPAEQEQPLAERAEAPEEAGSC